MRYEDRVTIATPEGVDLDIVLAGLGSRFLAAMIDAILQAILVTAAAFAVTGGGLVSDGSGPALGVAVFSLVVFFATWGYDVAFETLGSGKTPGKRATGIKVVRDTGHPIGFKASAIRNMMRVVDFLPSGYLVGVVSILLSGRNQRLGDLAAGTLVIREAKAPKMPVFEAPPEAPGELVHWDVSRVTTEEAGTVKRFLERRESLVPEARSRLAQDLATRLRAKVAGVPEGLTYEQFLEKLVAAKASRGRFD